MKRSHAFSRQGDDNSVKVKVRSESRKQRGTTVGRLAGCAVKPHVRRAGKYLIGPKLGASPVKSIVHCLGRRDATDQYFQLKILSLTQGAKETQDERQGKMLLHTEHSLLSLLDRVPGVVQKHDMFIDTALQVLKVSCHFASSRSKPLFSTCSSQSLFQVCFSTRRRSSVDISLLTKRNICFLFH